MQPLIRPILFYQLILLAAYWGSSFLVGAELFEGFISAKQSGVEVVALFSIPLLVFSLLFRKRVYFTIVDLLVVFFCGWSLINEAIILNSPFTDFSLHFFTICLWLVVYLFVRSISDKTTLLYGVVILWMIFSLLHLALGLTQLYGFWVSLHGLFTIVGAFYNCGFADLGIPVACVVFLILKINVKALLSCFRAHGSAVEACEEAFISTMIYLLFYPKYLLAKLYNESVRHQKANKPLAKYLIAM
ncbi:hypothetical protein ACT3CD_11405 [Geofilum sp. OHC36d9]|uniref:hypothetical protein n=1 Tax=Geofilum sp. OHC36d9 TaxID=3458413 RepID=UPI004033533F